MYIYIYIQTETVKEVTERETERERERETEKEREGCVEHTHLYISDSARSSLTGGPVARQGGIRGNAICSRYHV